jgi:tetratricopeptide (TPR) repeat protein
MQEEEIEATRSEKILAAAFVLFLLIGGIRVLGELRDIPAEPDFSDYEIRHGISALQNELPVFISQMQIAEQSYRQSLEEFNRAEEEYLFKREEHRTRLEEGTVDETLQREYEQATQIYETAVNNRDSANKNLNDAREIYNKKNNEINQLRLNAQKDFNAAIRLYEIKVILTRLLFVVPLFIGSIYVTQKARQRQSRYTILANSFMAFSILLLAYMVLEFTWRSFQVIGVSLIGALATGSALVYLKKEYFKPERVTLKRLSQRRCPYCNFPFEKDDAYCKNCGQSLEEKCRSCGSKRVKFAKHCQNCGASG